MSKELEDVLVSGLVVLINGSINTLDETERQLQTEAWRASLREFNENLQKYRARAAHDRAQQEHWRQVQIRELEERIKFARELKL